MPFFNLTSHGGGLGVIGGRSAGLKPFLTRQIIARGYVAGGYANSSPWTEVASCAHATDVTTSHGNLLGSAGGYIGGGCSLTTGYAFGSGGMGNYSTASRYNMVTKTGLSDMTQPYTFGDCESIQDNNKLTGGATALWVNGGSSGGISKLTISTDAYSTLGTSLSQGGTGASSHMTELFGIWWDDVPNNRKFVFATETESSTGAAGFYGQQKGISSKVGYGWAGNEGSYNGGYNLRKWNYTTESNVGTPAKPITNSGEENMTMGQDSQYMLGMYNASGQNNRSWKWTYATDSGFEGGASMQPSAPGSGRSSGGCGWCSV